MHQPTLYLRGLPGPATVIAVSAGVVGSAVNQAAEVSCTGWFTMASHAMHFPASLCTRGLSSGAEIYQEFKSPLFRRLHILTSRSVSSGRCTVTSNCRGSLDPVGSLNTVPLSQEVPSICLCHMEWTTQTLELLWPIGGWTVPLVDPFLRRLF